MKDNFSTTPYMSSNLREYNRIYKEVNDIYRETAARFGLSNNAFDILYTKTSTREDFDRLDYGLQTVGPHLFEVVLSPDTQVVPEPAPKRAVEDQLPLLGRKEFDRLCEMNDIASQNEKI